MWSMKSAAALAVGLWALILIYLAFSIHGRGSEDVSPQLIEKLTSALETLQDLQKQNKELRDLIEAERVEHAEGVKEERLARSRLLSQIKDLATGKPIDREEKQEVESVASKDADVTGLHSKDHEVARRKLDSGIWEMFYYLHKQLKAPHINNTEVLRKHVEDQLVSLLGNSAYFGSVDNAERWRKAELQKLTGRIQKKIDEIQNPSDCSKTRVLTCNLDKECGFGCQLHHVAYCFVVAFGEQRMMVLKDDGRKWRYSRSGWTSAFQPITKCSFADATSGDNGVAFSQQSKARVVNLGIVDGLADRPQHLPLSFPKQLADDLVKLHSNPAVFFISQFIWYLMRGSDGMEKVTNLASSHIPFGKTPVVGLQVRRTDKVGTEAAFHALDEYMEWAEVWYKVQERKLGKSLNRTVYIASDDPEVVPEAKRKYANYTVFGDVTISQNAQVAKRYTDSSLSGVVTDIRILSKCDYLVCTFSSQVCRMGYELMQVLQGDAGENFHSLDDLYYYGGQFAHEQVAVEDYVARGKDEIDIRTGDVIGIAGNHWDGYSKGNNRRTGKTGLYPSYKAVEKWRIVDFPAMG